MADPTREKPNLKAVEIDYSRAKVGLLAFLEVAAALGFGLALQLSFAHAAPPYLVLALGAGVIFLAFFLLEIFFIKSSAIAFEIVMGQAIAIVIPFYGFFSVTLLEVFFIGAVLLILAAQSGRRDLAESLRIRFWRIGKAALPKAILGMSLFTGGLYYLNTVSASADFPVSEPTFQNFVQFIEPPIRGFFPDFSSSLTMHEFLTRMTAREVSQELGKNAEVPDSLRKQMVAQTVNQAEDRLTAYAGVKPDFSAPIPKALYDLLRAKIDAWTAKGAEAASAIFAGLLVVSLLGFTWPVRLIAEIVAFLLYELLLIFGFARIELEGRSREILVVR